MVVHSLEDWKARNLSDCQLFFCLMAPRNARSIAASCREAKKCGDIQMEPVKAASLAADPSFVLLDSHIDKFDSKDDGGVSAHTTTVPAQSNVFDALPLHQENPLVLAQGCANLSVLADLAGYIFLAGLGPARTIFRKCGKCDHQVRQVQYETRVMQVQQ